LSRSLRLESNHHISITLLNQNEHSVESSVIFRAWAGSFFLELLKKKNSMKGLSYVTNVQGEKIALQIDLDSYKEETIIELLEDVEDLADIELRKKDDKLSWQDAKTQLKQEGIID
jgi:hypothetical protein